MAAGTAAAALTSVVPQTKATTNTATNMTAEAYDPGTGIWSSIASVPVLLTDPMACYARELGPAVTRPDARSTSNPS